MKSSSRTGGAWEFVERERIAYVYYGPRERAMGDDPAARYPFLTSAYSNESVRIYRVEGASAR